MHIPGTDIVVCVDHATDLQNSADRFVIDPYGPIYLRCREAGDSMRLPGGTKTLKKLFIDKKVPAMNRNIIPVIADEKSVLGVMGFGPNLDRLATGLPALEIRFEKIDMEDVQ